MFAQDQYELLDFGDGRKLERCGACLLDRPAPAAAGARRQVPEMWARADGLFKRTTVEQGRWQWRNGPPSGWRIRHGELVLELRPTDSGQVGLFPEQLRNWDWIADRIHHAASPVRVLNLFAYTGGSTLAAALAGAPVTHVDAAKTAVEWARWNAELSGLAAAPVRWIVDDALSFARRELKRGRQYNAVILDPPSYGHGAGGERWTIHEQLAPLLETCRDLTSERREFVLLTCHTSGLGPQELEASLSECIFGQCGSGVTAEKLAIASRQGGLLPSGAMARWP